MLISRVQKLKYKNLNIECYANFQSELEQVATSLVDKFYAQATLSSGEIAERYPWADNELRLKEAFWLAQVPLMQIDQHL